MVERPHWTNCPYCGRQRPRATISDGRCDLDRIEAERLQASAAFLRREIDVSWDGPQAVAIKEQRNQLLDFWAWTVRPGSPLTQDCQQAFILFFGSLHRLTIDFSIPAEVIMPEPPALVYGD